MGGFFDVIKRMAEGKPAFEDESNPDKESKKPSADIPADSKPAGPAIRKGDESSFPVVHIKRVKTRVNGNDMEVYCHIVNTWHAEVMLDKIRLAGTVRELDDFLDPNEEREFLVYRGPLLKKENHEAQLHYKTREEGDYFEAVHDVTFTYHASNDAYSINEMRLRSPIRDIYG